MQSTFTLPADAVAERIVRHFQDQGFSGISEALIIRIRLKEGDRLEIDEAFETALEHDQLPPVHQCFEIHPFGHFSEARSFAEARAAVNSDFSVSLRIDMPRVFFDPAPVVIDDPLASGTKYDAIMKLSNNIDGYAFAILLNDPDYSFLDYIGTHHGDDWQKIMGNFEDTIVSLGPEIDL